MPSGWSIRAAQRLQCVQPFGQWSRERHGGREYRGVRTRRHTYVRDLGGPWLLYDNALDPYQARNLANDPGAGEIRGALDETLFRKLEERGDEFRPGMEYVERWGYRVDATGTVPYER